MPTKEKLSWIKKKIQETEQELEKNKITLATANEYEKLLEIYHELWELLYFKLHQEESYLLK